MYSSILVCIFNIPQEFGCVNLIFDGLKKLSRIFGIIQTDRM
jgi:hypothetical protein